MRPRPVISLATRQAQRVMNLGPVNGYESYISRSGQISDWAGSSTRNEGGGTLGASGGRRACSGHNHNPSRSIGSTLVWNAQHTSNGRHPSIRFSRATEMVFEITMNGTTSAEPDAVEEQARRGSENEHRSQGYCR